MATAEQDIVAESVHSPSAENCSLSGFKALPTNWQPSIASIDSQGRSGNTALSYLPTLKFCRVSIQIIFIAHAMLAISTLSFFTWCNTIMWRESEIPEAYPMMAKQFSSVSSLLNDNAVVLNFSHVTSKEMLHFLQEKSASKTWNCIKRNLPQAFFLAKLKLTKRTAT